MRVFFSVLRVVSVRRILIGIQLAYSKRIIQMISIFWPIMLEICTFKGEKVGDFCKYILFFSDHFVTLTELISLEQFIRDLIKVIS